MGGLHAGGRHVVGYAEYHEPAAVIGKRTKVLRELCLRFLVVEIQPILVFHV